MRDKRLAMRGIYKEILETEAKNFGAEFDRLKVQFGFLDTQRLETEAIMALADLPSLDVLRATLLGLLNAPATKLVVLINTPATQLARVIKAKAEKV